MLVMCYVYRALQEEAASSFIQLLQDLLWGALPRFCLKSWVPPSSPMLLPLSPGSPLIDLDLPEITEPEGVAKGVVGGTGLQGGLVYLSPP